MARLKQALSSAGDKLRGKFRRDVARVDVAAQDLARMRTQHQQAMHGPVAEADPYSFQVAHRRLAWMLRISAGGNVVFMFVIVVLASLLKTLFPLKTTDVALVRSYDSRDKMYLIEPVSKGVAGFDVALEGFAKRYVKECLEVDSVTQVERMRFCSRSSDGKYFERFIKERRSQTEKDISSGLTRSISTDTAERIEAVGGTYKFAVEYTKKDKRNGSLIEEIPLRAYLNIVQRPQRVGPADKYENPHGFTVLDMALKERASQ